MKKVNLLAVGLFTASIFPTIQAQNHPNVVVILCDDMGYSDLGSYGGEIKTPHIDALAQTGVRFTQFKNTGRSCPSRASLLTGRYQHAVGMGWMTAVDEHRQSYRGQITEKYPTIAEVFKNNGYQTYMSGKWHVTVSDACNTPESPNGSFPYQRGFDQYYGTLEGANNYYTPHNLIDHKKHITNFPPNYYYTNAITAKAVEDIKNHATDKPLFLYLAHYAPHRPLQAPQDRIDACMKRYQVGYDVLKKQRFERMKKLGLIDKEAVLPIHDVCFDHRPDITSQSESMRKKWQNQMLPYHQKRPSWKTLDPLLKKEWIKEMATYAAMIEIMDDGIGEVVQALKDKKMYDNTVILFLSDNGSTLEGGLVSQLRADLANTPFRDYKQWCYLGGTSSPLIIHYPKKYAQYNGQLRKGYGHIMDILPTCLDLAKISYPQTFNDKTIPSTDGITLVPLLNNQKIKNRELCFEHQTSSAIISGHYKLVRLKYDQPWELYNLDTDPFEQYNLSKELPQKAKELEVKWTTWGKKNHIFPLEKREWNTRVKYYKGL